MKAVRPARQLRPRLLPLLIRQMFGLPLVGEILVMQRDSADRAQHRLPQPAQVEEQEQHPDHELQDVERHLVENRGWKAMSRYPTAPLPKDLGAVRLINMSAEHTTLDLERGSERPKVGERLAFIVGHSDATVFLHDALFATRNGEIELAWPLLARGKVE